MTLEHKAHNIKYIALKSIVVVAKYENNQVPPAKEPKDCPKFQNDIKTE